jgi:hypothetical protein
MQPRNYAENPNWRVQEISVLFVQKCEEPALSGSQHRSKQYFITIHISLRGCTAYPPAAESSVLGACCWPHLTKHTGAWRQQLQLPSVP